MSEKTIVDITPDKSLIQKLGLTGYKTEQAISELIDNSIDARLNEEQERIDVVLDFARGIISISDTGMGMDLNGLKNGLTIAKGTKFEEEKLGRFGLGMKSACSTLGKAFTIETTKKDSDIQYFVTYDEDDWLKDTKKKWANFEIENRKKPRPWHGTIITISKLKVSLYPNQVSQFAKSFGIRYGAYLKSNQISLFVNSRECKPIEPEIVQNSKQDLNIMLSNGNYLKGWIGLLEKRSIKGDYGIHLYKNDRLIKAFDKFGIRHHPEVAKITGELHLDHVPVNFHKTGFIEDSVAYKEALEAFRTNEKVIKVLRSSISKSTSVTSIASVLNYFADETQKGMIGRRLSAAKTQTLLQKATTFPVQRQSQKFEFIFEDGKEDELYRIEHIGLNLYKIFINRKSPVFDVFGNPLFLIGLIEVEVKSVLNNMKDYDRFIKERNSSWVAFVRNWTQKGDKRMYPERKSEVTPLPGYSLVPELVDLHDFIKEKFEHDFQFTGLSTLRPFLHNAYAKIVYSLHTTTGAGQHLHDLISDYDKEDYAVLLDPKKPRDIKIALDVSEKNQFIVIREYATRMYSTWAAPEKAWLDLFFEFRKGYVPISGQDLTSILDSLLESGLVDPEKLDGIAKHRNLDKEISQYFGSVD